MAGYSGTPLAKKLGIRDGSRVVALGAPPGYQALLAPLPDAAVWVSWPKKAARLPTDITEDTVRAVALPMGYVDVKVCAVDDMWSGLKLVIRKALR